MAGRIRDDDIALVRERARIDEVVREHVQLKNAGGGSLKGLCPFHDERSPSFHVTPARGYFHCFGCGEGGDIITFLMKIDHLTFAEAVEKLAIRAGVQLRYEEGGVNPSRQQGQRTRLVEAHRLAAEFYSEQLMTPEADIGRTFLKQRGFDRAVSERFGVGFAPQSWDALTNVLREKGFTEQELIAGGLVSQGARGTYDRFRGRLVWPIKDIGGDVIGFGARKLSEEDTGPKYLNTPETPLYKKSQVLYGVEMAKREIARRQQAVIVEGYTDVMACHLAGVETAVATCGTAFGQEHIKVLRRLLMDQNEFRGEVVFTFDGDAAGQKAALRAFEDDQKFVAQTFVAVEPTGLDPCDLRLQHGDEAVRELVARRAPLFEFAIKSTLAQFDLDTAEGRIGALQSAAPLVGRIRDRALRPEYARALAGWLGMEVGPVNEAVGRAERADAGRSRTPAPARRAAPTAEGPADEAGVAAEAPALPPLQRPDPNDRDLHVEREALKLALQQPAIVGPRFDGIERAAFTAPAYALTAEAVEKAGGIGAGIVGEQWVTAVREAAEDDRIRGFVTELAVEPLLAESEQDVRYAESIITALEERLVTRRIVEVKSRLQRTNPLEDADAHNRMFGELVALESYRRALRERAVGEL
jgi:DNA primase